MKKVICFSYVVFLVIIFASLKSQGQSVFKEQINILDSTTPGKMIELPGGDVLLQGHTTPVTGYGREFFCRIGESGNIVWTRQFIDSSGFAKWNFLMYLDSTGIIHSVGSSCTDLDLNGNVLNHKTLSYGMFAAQRSGNGFKIAGNSFIYDLDSAYNPAPTINRITVNSLPLNNYKDYGLKQTSDLGYVYYGRVTKSGFTDSESKFLFIKFDSSLQLQWYRMYKSANPADSAFSVSELIQTSSGDYVATFVHDSFRRVYSIKLDSSGNLKWGRSIFVPANSLYFHVVEDPNTGNYLYTMNMSSGLFAPRTVGILKTDTAFNILSAYSYMDSVSNYHTEHLSGTLPLSNGQFMLKTIKYDTIPSYFGVFLMKTNSDLLTGCNDSARIYTDSIFNMAQTFDTLVISTQPSTIISSPSNANWVSNSSVEVFCQVVGISSVDDESELNVFPNPFSNTISINVETNNKKHITFTLRNILGQTVYNHQENNPGSSFMKNINLNFLSTGIYLLDVTIDGKRTVKKIVKE